MSSMLHCVNQIREHRVRLGLTQAELADRADISRTAVSAVEQGRAAPSVDAALRLARVLGCTVEDLFADRRGARETGPLWVGPPPRAATRVWQAQIDGRLVNLPAEPTAQGLLRHDRLLASADAPEAARPAPDAGLTLVIACCDPAISLLLETFARACGFRPICLQRTSAEALELLRQGAIHLAGVHFAAVDEAGGNAGKVSAALGTGHSLLHVAQWETGVACQGAGCPTARSLTAPGVRWIGRAAGSGSRACQDQVLGAGRVPRHTASTHRAVADALKSGYADAGISTRLVAEEAGLSFMSVRRERFDLCLRSNDTGDPRVASLIGAVRSRSYRNAVSALPGYAIPSDSGELEPVA